MDHHTARMQCQYSEGRADEAPKLHVISQSLEEYLNGNNCEECEWLGMVKRAKKNNTKNIKSNGRDLGAIWSDMKTFPNGAHSKYRLPQCVSKGPELTIMTDPAQSVLGGVQFACKGFQRECYRPTSPAPGFDPNHSIEA